MRKTHKKRRIVLRVTQKHARGEAETSSRGTATPLGFAQRLTRFIKRLEKVLQYSTFTGVQFHRRLHAGSDLQMSLAIAQ